MMKEKVDFREVWDADISSDNEWKWTNDELMKL